jgi:serine/threonine-protein kinase
MMAAHSAGIIHRDLKPENVFLALNRRAGGAPFVVKVLDFGIAKLAAEAGTRGTTGAMGSPLWMAPEQTERGQITAAADVWALGLMAYFALTGAVFWRAARDPQTTVAQVLREIVLEPIPAATVRANESGLLERLPPGFDRFFAQAVARDPNMRFKDASAFWTALSTLLDATGATMVAVPSSGLRPHSSQPQSAPPLTPMPMSPMPMSPMPLSPAMATPPMQTAPAIASTMTRTGSVGPWIFASAVFVVGALAATAWFVVRTRPIPKDMAQVSTAPLASTTAPASAIATATTQETTSATATSIAGTAPASTTTTTSAKTAKINATDVSHGTTDSYADGLSKRRTWKVAGHTIKVVPGNVQVSGNVPANVVRDAIDWQPWEYLRCYEKQFSSATSLPHGTVTLTFKIFDQLPRNGSIDKSDFSNPAFSKCVLDTAMGNTANAAGADGFATVVYPLVFSVVD